MISSLDFFMLHVFEVMELTTFYSYLTNLDTFFQSELQRLRQKNEQQRLIYLENEQYLIETGQIPERKNTGIYQDEAGMSWDDDFDIGQMKQFQQMFLESFLITLYSFLETRLIERCRIVRDAYSYSDDYPEMRRDVIDAAKKYLTKVHHIRYNFGNLDWQEIDRFRHFRNAIVHNRGYLHEGTKHDKYFVLRQAISKAPDLDIDDDRLVISLNYCKRILETVSRFLTELDPRVRSVDA